MGDYLHSLLCQTNVGHKLICESEDNFDRSWLHHLGQHPKFDKPTELLGPLDTHATIFSFNENRLLVPFELLTAMGTWMYDGDGCSASPYYPIFTDMKLSDIKLLVGNGIHVPIFSAFLAYALSHIRDRDDFLTFDRFPLSSEQDDELIWIFA